MHMCTCLLSLSLLPRVPAKENRTSTRGDGDHLQVRKTALTRTRLCRTLTSDFLWNCEKINPCCLNHHVFGVLWKTEQTITGFNIPTLLCGAIISLSLCLLGFSFHSSKRQMIIIFLQELAGLQDNST
jgi:hypothetical protein